MKTGKFENPSSEGKSTNSIKANSSYLGRLWKDIKAQRYLMLFVWPVIIWLIIFWYLPLFGVAIAFQDYNVGLGVLGSKWAGLKHFKDLLSDPLFHNALRNTLMYSFLNLIIGFPIPIIFATMINELIGMRPFKRVVQTISYMPHFLSWAFVASFLISFFAGDGLFNQLLRSIGISSEYAYMANTGSFVAVIVISSIWKSFGYGSIIYLSAMTSVDPEIYEAALIDGANRCQKIRSITLPSIKPTIVVLLILQISQMMNSNFDQFFLLSNPLVSEIARVIDVYTYSIGIQKGRFAYGTAVGLFKSVVALVLLITANTASKKIADESIF
ncbi:MAG TPA: protein lplB [Clostridiales bacterium]|nr:protein lplB [Clostridiales bacterium]